MTINDTVVLDEAGPLDEVGASAPAWSTATIPHRLIEIAVAGALLAVLMNLIWLDLRPDIARAPSHAFFWVKAVYTGALGVAGLRATAALGRPYGAVSGIVAIAGALVAAMLIAAAVQAVQMDRALLARLFRPAGIAACLFNIVALAAPMLVFATLGLRRVDLERPAAMGMAAGVFCGGVAASVYGLHCPHETYVFVGLWYTAGIALCGAIGAGALALLNRSAGPVIE